MKECQQNSIVFNAKNISTVLISFAFTLYNLIIGIGFKAIWNSAISAYYFLLMIVKFFLILHIYKSGMDKKIEIRAYVISFALLLMLNISLVGPAILLVLNEKTLHATKITSIAMATYVFINVVMALINLKKEKRNLITKQLKLVALINALVSIMVLENTLINVNGSLEGNMFVLSLVTTLFIIFFLLFITIFTFLKNMRKVYLSKGV